MITKKSTNLSSLPAKAFTFSFSVDTTCCKAHSLSWTCCNAAARFCWHDVNFRSCINSFQAATQSYNKNDKKWQNLRNQHTGKGSQHQLHILTTIKEWHSTYANVRCRSERFWNSCHSCDIVEIQSVSNQHAHLKQNSTDQLQKRHHTFGCSLNFPWWFNE